MLFANAVGVRFTFKHKMEQFVVRRRKDASGEIIIETEPRPVTHCYLQTSNGKQFEGEAITHPNDVFLKETGRKKSLARALKESGLGYEERKKVWDAYFER